MSVKTEVQYVFGDKGFEKLDKLDQKLSRFDKHLVSTEKGLGKMEKAQGKAGGAMSRFNNIGSKNAAILEGIGRSAPIAGEAIGALANPYAAAAAAAIALGAAYFKAGKDQLTWQRQMSKVNVTAQLQKNELKGLSDEILAMPWYGNSKDQVPDAFNQIISGVGDVDKSMDILQNSLKGSKAGFTDLTTTADAAVNVMNSVGNTTAKEVFDVLFATLNKGKGEFKDIANYLPKIIPFSNQLGLSFKETSAAFALFTSRGQSAEATTTLLQNAYRSLADSSKRKNIEKLVAVFDNTGKVRPMVQIIEDLDKKFAGLSDEKRIKKLSSLGLDAEAGSAFSIFMQNIDAFKEFDDVIENSSKDAGALEDALKNAASPLDGLDTATEKLQKAWLYLGEKSAPLLEKIINKINDLFDWIGRVEEKTGIFSAAFELMGGIIELVLDVITVPFEQIGKLIEWITGDTELFGSTAAAAGNTAVSSWEFFFRIIGDTLGVLTDILGIFGDLITLDFDGLENSWDELKTDLSNFGDIPVKIKPVVDNKAFAYLLPPGLQMQAYMQDKSQLPGAPAKPTADGIDTGSNDDIKSVAGGGNQVRNVYVNIKSLVEKVENHITNLQGGIPNLRQIIEEELARAVHDAEIAL